MKSSRFSAEQITMALRQAEAGTPREETAAAPKRAVKEPARKPKGPAVHTEDIADHHTARQQWADAATKRDQVK